LSTPIPMSTGSIDSWVIHEVVIPFHSSPEAEPTRARAFGIFHVTLFTVSEFTVSESNITSRNRTRHPNVPPVRILIATTGVLPAAPTAEFCRQLIGDRSSVAVMTVIRVPRSFLEALDDDVRRSFLDAADNESTEEEKAAAYLEERGRRAVDPICAALAAEEIDCDIHFVEGDDPAEAIISTAQRVGAELVVMGATRRLFTEEAWRSVSARVMVNSHLPVLLVPGARLEDTMEMPVIEL
jgi:nucleotide-binding universal stress UspA family protein